MRRRYATPLPSTASFRDCPIPDFVKVYFVQTIHRVDMVLLDLEDQVPVDSPKRNRLANYGGAGILYCQAGLSVLLLLRFDSP